jgi:hypothetical protein
MSSNHLEFPADNPLLTLLKLHPTIGFPLKDRLIPPWVQKRIFRRGIRKGTSRGTVSERSCPGIDAILFQVSEDLVDRF